MATKKLETSEGMDFDFNSDDFDLDFDISGSIDQSAKEKKKRSPIEVVARGTVEGAKETLKSPEFYKTFLQKVLPSTYGTIEEAASTAATSYHDLLNETIREEKPKLKQIAGKLKQLVPDQEGKLYKLLKDFEGEHDMPAGASKEQQEEQGLNTTLGAIFKIDQAKDKVDEAKKVISDKIEKDRFDTSLDVLNRIREDVSSVSQYTTTITQAVQRKSLEIQIRSYTLQAEYSRKSLQYFEFFKSQNEGIIKNTALPEYAKIKLGERIKQSTKERFVNALYGEGDNFFARGIGRLKGRAKEYISGLSDSLNNLNDGLSMSIEMREQMKSMNEMAREFGEEEMTPTRMAGNMAGEWGINKARDYLADKVKGKVPNKVKEALAGGATAVLNPGAAIEKLRNSDYWREKTDLLNPMSDGYNLLDSILSEFTGRAPSKSIDKEFDVNNLDEVSQGTTNRVNLSLTTIIPGYLSHIQREIAMLRTGGDVPLLKFDYTKGGFISEKQLGERIQQRLEKRSKASMYGMQLTSATSLFDPENTLSEKDQLSLKIFIANLARMDDVDYSVENIRGTSAYGALSREAQALVDKYLEKMEFGDSTKQSKHDLTKSIMGTKQAMPSLDEEIQKLVKLGYGDILREKGFLKDSPGASYQTDVEFIKQFIQDSVAKPDTTGLSVTSDMMVKNTIRPTSTDNIFESLSKKMSPSNAYNAFKKTKLYNYFYNKGASSVDPEGKEQQQGPMAQEVRQNFGEETAPGGKKINLTDINAAAFSAVKYLGDKVESLGKSAFDKYNAFTKEREEARLAANKSNKPEDLADGDHLGHIRYDVEAIRDLLKKKGLGFSVPDLKLSSEPIDYEKTKQSIKDRYTATKDKIKEFDIPGKLGDLIQQLKDTARPFVDQGMSFLTDTKDFIKDKFKWAKDEFVPSQVKKLSDIYKGVKDTILKRFDRVKDIYVNGLKDPAIEGRLLEAGKYRDQVTGKVLKTMDDIIECKNNIVDETGKLVLSLKDRAKGLYDQHGDEIKGMAFNLGQAVANFGLDMYNRASKNIKTLFNSSLSIPDRFKKIFSGFKLGSPSEEIGMKSYEVLVDIRDILLGEQDTVKERLKKKTVAKALADSLLGGGDSGAGSTDTGTTDSGDAATPQGNTQGASSGNVIPGMFSFGKKMFDKGKEKLTQAKQNYDTRPGSDGFVGPTMPSAAAAAPGTREGFFSRMKNKIPSTGKGKLALAGKLAKAGGGKLMGLARGAAGLLGGMLGGGEGGQQQGQPQQDQQAVDQQTKEGEENYGLLKTLKNKIGRVAKKDRAWNDKDGTGTRDGSSEDQHDKIEALKEARKKKAAEADLSVRYKNDGLGGIMGMLGSVFGFIKDGIGGIFNLSKSVISKLPGLSKFLKGAVGKGSAIRSAVTGIAKFAGRQVVGTGLRAAVMIGGKAALMAGGTLLSAAGAVAGTILSVLSSPVVLTVAAIAATGYGIFKLYQYANRNNASDIERARLKQYGFAYNTAVERNNHYCYKLEAYFQDGRINYNRGRATINAKSVKEEELLELLGIDKEDKEAKKNLMGWLENRFKPIFLSHLTALFGINNKVKLKDVDAKLTDAEKLSYLEKVRFDEGPYSYDISPVKELESLTVDKEDIKKTFDILIKNYQDKLNNKAKPTPLPKDETIKKDKKNPTEPDKAKTEAQKQAEALKASNERQKEASKVTEALKENTANVSDDGGKPATTGAGSSSSVAADGAIIDPPAPANLKSAGGSILEGAAGMQYIKMGKNTTLDGVDPAMLKNFLGMAEEYGKATGKSINVDSGYRSYEQQAYLYKTLPKGRAAKPGRSLHEFGMAVDINRKDAAELEKLGLMKKYGFTRPMGQEPWHVEPAGIQGNIDAARSDASIRSKLIMAGLYKGGGGYGTLSNSVEYKRDNNYALKLLNIEPNIGEEIKKEDPILAGNTPNQPTTAAALKQPVQEPKTETQRAERQSEVAATSYLPDAKQISESIAAKGTTPQEQNKELYKQNKAENTSPYAETEKAVQGPSAAEPTGKSGNSGVSGDVKAIIKKAAQDTGTDPNLLTAYAAVESDLNPNAKAKTSSASGLFQFIDKTWDGYIKKYGAKFNIPPGTSPFDPYANSVMGAMFLKDNQKALRSVKQDVNVTDAYLAHFLGPGGATTFLKSNPNQIAADVMPKAAGANKGIFYDKAKKPRTFKEIYDELGNRIKKKASANGINVQTSSLTTEAAKGPGGDTNILGETGQYGVAGTSPAAPTTTPETSGASTPSSPLQPTGKPAAPSASPVAPSSPSSIMPSATPAKSPEEISFKDIFSNKSPLGMDTRRSYQTANTGAQAIPDARPNTGNLENLAEKANEILSKSHDVLTKIQENTSFEKLVAAFIQGTSGLKTDKEGSPEDMKKQDQINMRRGKEVTPPSIDLKRYPT